MSFDKSRLPDPQGYFEGLGLVLSRRGKWRSTSCEFHGGSDSMRVNLQSGSWVCMAGCGARGGDILAYEQAHSGTSFVDSAKALGAWVEDSTASRACYGLCWLIYSCVQHEQKVLSQ